jgi:hypothetical protein
MSEGYIFRAHLSAANGYPRFLAELLSSCPVSGQGVHAWLFRVARYLHHFHGPDEIFALLEQRTTNCGRHISAQEITDAIDNSATCAWTPSGKSPALRRAEWIANPVVRPRTPVFDAEKARQRAAHIQADITPEWLKERSPMPVGDLSSEDYLRAVLVHGEHAVIFDRCDSGGWLWPGGINLSWLADAHRAEGIMFLCNPVDGELRLNPRTCNMSKRSEENLTSFRHAVLECDLAPREFWRPVWLKILVSLPLAIVSIVFSARRSDHALIRTGASSKEEWNAFKRRHLLPLVEFGADPGALSAVRLTRLGSAYRGETLQELLYLNPAADGTPIFYPRRISQ